MTTARIGYGITLTLNTGAGAVAVTQLVDVKGPGIKIKVVDCSNQDSANAFREFIPGMGDGGSITFNVIAFNTNRAQFYALLRTSGVTAVVTFQGPNTWTVTGFVESVDDGSPLDDTQTLDISFKVTGKPVYA